MPVLWLFFAFYSSTAKHLELLMGCLGCPVCITDDKEMTLAHVSYAGRELGGHSCSHFW